jgi:hypothetical protein
MDRREVRGGRARIDLLVDIGTEPTHWGKPAGLKAQNPRRWGAPGTSLLDRVAR